MPQQDLFATLSDLVRQGGSQRSIIASVRGRGFRASNDSLRGLINALRGNRLTVNQFEATRIITTRFNFRVPRAINFVVKLKAQYEVNRNEAGRATRPLLQGSVSETLRFKIPVDADAQTIIAAQSGARIEEQILAQVRQAGLAQAGNYISPKITSSPPEVISARFTDFITVGNA